MAHILKILGEEREFTDEQLAEAIAKVQKVESADVYLQEASTKLKSVEEDLRKVAIFERASKGDVEAARELGVKILGYPPEEVERALQATSAKLSGQAPQPQTSQGKSKKAEILESLAKAFEESGLDPQSFVTNTVKVVRGSLGSDLDRRLNEALASLKEVSYTKLSPAYRDNLAKALKAAVTMTYRESGGSGEVTAEHIQAAMKNEPLQALVDAYAKLQNTPKIPLREAMPSIAPAPSSGNTSTGAVEKPVNLFSGDDDQTAENFTALFVQKLAESENTG